MKFSVLFLFDQSFTKVFSLDFISKYLLKYTSSVECHYASPSVSAGIALDQLASLSCDLLISVGDISLDNYPVFIGDPVHLNIPDLSPNAAVDQLCDKLPPMLMDALFDQRRQFNAIFQTAESGIVAHDLKRRIILFNPAAEAITGLSASQVLGRDCHDVFPPSFCGPNCTFCNMDHLDLAESHYPVVYHTDDGRKDLFLSVSPLIRNDHPYAVLVSIRNDTEIKRITRHYGAEKEFHRLTGNADSMRHIYEVIRNAGAYDFPVLVHGESGTGKELIADALHKESRRKGLFVPVNCGAIPEGTIESELFGHEKGSFTGAIRTKKGRFELADGGTIFLDEIGEMPLSMQVKLLRVLQEGVIQSVGGEREKKIDVRVVSATNRNLSEMVADGTFREDLYYRLNVIPIKVPPLRERGMDIILLANRFLEQLAERFNRPGLCLHSSTQNLFLSYEWPGNVRQLLNSIQYALIKCSGSTILPTHLPPELAGTDFVPSFPPKILESEVTVDDDEIIGREAPLLRSDVVSAIVKAGGNKAKAARILGVGRTTLYNYIKRDNQIMEEVSSKLVH